MTKKDLQEKMRSIVNRYADGSLVKGEDLVFAMSVLRRNPDYDLKVSELKRYGNGVCLAVDRGKFGTRCFYLCSLDMQKKISISYKYQNKSMSIRQEVSNALREADEERVSDFRSKVPAEFKCPFTGMTVSPGKGDKFDVDHYDRSVYEVADAILKFSADMPEKIRKYIVQGEKGGCVFVEPLRSKFKNFMADHTKLRYASTFGNRSDGAAKKMGLDELYTSVMNDTFKSEFEDVQKDIDEIRNYAELRRLLHAHRL